MMVSERVELIEFRPVDWATDDDRRQGSSPSNSVWIRRTKEILRVRGPGIRSALAHF